MQLPPFHRSEGGEGPREGRELGTALPATRHPHSITPLLIILSFFQRSTHEMVIRILSYVSGKFENSDLDESFFLRK